MSITRRNMILASTAFLMGGTLKHANAGLIEEDYDASITAFLNKIRHEHGVQPLVMHRQLQHVALYQSQLMAKRDKLKHSAGFGKGFRSRMRQSGIHAMAAENIASGHRDYGEVFAAWMRSSGHRRNMLDPDFAYYGLASCASERRPHHPYWTLILSL